MFALFDDCVFGPIEDPVYGRQPEVVEGWYANGWTPSPGHRMVGDPSTWPRLAKYVIDIISTFKDNPRVWVWDLYNEPKISKFGNHSIALVGNTFAWARKVGPMQPLTVGQYNSSAKLNNLIFLQSDIITFHNYGTAENLTDHIARLKQHDRPLICTEWLNRGRGSLVETYLPVFVKEKVGCMHWGLVNGRTQTDLNWGHRPGQPDPPLWQHDIYHEDYTPYKMQELDLFRHHIERNSLKAHNALNY